MTYIKTLIIETANRRDLTFAENFNGRAYALMDADWIGYFDTLDDVIEYLCILLETDNAEKEDKGYGMTNGEYVTRIVEQDEDFCIVTDVVDGTVTIEVSLEWWNKSQAESEEENGNK